MISKESSLAENLNEEIPALIETLLATEQRLEDLTEGQVDTVAGRDGRTLVLRRAQDQMRHNEAVKQSAILNALPAHIALLDGQGFIISVNEAWRSFADRNALAAPEHGWASITSRPATRLKVITHLRLIRSLPAFAVC